MVTMKTDIDGQQKAMVMDKGKILLKYRQMDNSKTIGLYYSYALYILELYLIKILLFFNQKFCCLMFNINSVFIKINFM